MNVFKNYRYWLLAAAVFAVLAAVAAIQTVRSFAGVVQVVAVKRDVAANEMLTANDLTLVEQAKGSLYPDVVAAPRDAAGMVARGFIPAGTVLRRSMLMPPQQAGVAGSVAALGGDYVAVAVPNTLGTTVAGTLAAGNRVDIYSRASDKEPPVKVAADVLVLQAGTVQTSQGAQPTQGVILALAAKDLDKVLPYFTGGKENSLTFVLKPPAGAAQQANAGQPNGPALPQPDVSTQQQPGISQQTGVAPPAVPAQQLSDSSQQADQGQTPAEKKGAE